MWLSIFHHRESGLRLVDGGVWANNPVAVGVNEAIGVLSCQFDRIDVLSIGTTTSPFHLKPKKQEAGRLGWARVTIPLLLEAQARGMAGLAHVVTQHEERLIRIDPMVAPGRFSLDDAQQISDLRAVGERAARHLGVLVNERFLDEPAPAFEPYSTVPVDSIS